MMEMTKIDGRNITDSMMESVHKSITFKRKDMKVVFECLVSEFDVSGFLEQRGKDFYCHKDELQKFFEEEDWGDCARDYYQAKKAKKTQKLQNVQKTRDGLTKIDGRAVSDKTLEIICKKIKIIPSQLRLLLNEIQKNFPTETKDFLAKHRNNYFCDVPKLESFLENVDWLPIVKCFDDSNTPKMVKLDGRTVFKKTMNIVKQKGNIKEGQLKLVLDGLSKGFADETKDFLIKKGNDFMCDVEKLESFLNQVDWFPKVEKYLIEKQNEKFVKINGRTITPNIMNLLNRKIVVEKNRVKKILHKIYVAFRTETTKFLIKNNKGLYCKITLLERFLKNTDWELAINADISLDKPFFKPRPVMREFRKFRKGE